MLNSPSALNNCVEDIRTFNLTQLKLSGATPHVGLLCPSHYTGPLEAEVHEQMSRSSDQSEARDPSVLSPSKLGTPLSTLCCEDERLS
ncbi:hypothetical protein TNCV_861921 [Trichonephila clavipes]|nr:hypothetical protein TNCV_861921 [Trichonephila clavipes]